MGASRERIITYLRTYPRSSAADIATRLYRTRADIRHHLGEMLEEGLVVAENQKSTGARGRPERLFSLAEDNLVELGQALLCLLLAGKNPQEKEGLLQSLARQLASQAAGDEFAGLPRGPGLARRLGKAVRCLNLSYYQARWEAHSRGPRVLLHHCPYQPILKNHPELCRMDALLLETMVGLPFEQAARLGENGASACIFSAVTISDETSHSGI